MCLRMRSYVSGALRLWSRPSVEICTLYGDCSIGGLFAALDSADPTECQVARCRTEIGRYPPQALAMARVYRSENLSQLINVSDRTIAADCTQLSSRSRIRRDPAGDMMAAGSIECASFRK